MDFFDGSLDYLEGKEKREGTALAEQTKQNIKTLNNITESGKEIGENLHGFYTEQDVEDFCNAIKEGYNKTTELINLEEQEMKRINNFFKESIEKEKNQ